MSQIDRLQQLLNQCAQGDHNAFAELYRSTAPKLFPLSVRILKRRDWAEEALQESFVRIWQGAGRYDPGRGSVMTWMTSIVRYGCLDMLPHERLQPPLLPGVGQQPRSLGLIPITGNVTLPLSEQAASELSKGRGFAVSREPAGGSPTGLPTGPVLFQGQALLL